MALVAETMVWPIPFLINMFTALKGSQFNFFLHCSRGIGLKFTGLSLTTDWSMSNNFRSGWVDRMTNVFTCIRNP